jgi:predicted dehydrogenase
MKNIAIIGCGRISKNHVQAIANNANAKLYAVCDIIRENAEKRAEEYGSSLDNRLPKPIIYTDYRDMLEKESNIDIATICTESGYHSDIAVYCMDRGLHVIVEKPMALSIKDAERMIGTAEKNNVKLCVSHQNRFNPPIQRLRRAVEEGRFGKIIAGNARVLWNRNEDYYKQAPWRGTYELDGGCLMNQCIHNIDLLQWMLGGEAEWVNGAVGNYVHPYIEAEDYGSVQIKFKNGAIGNVEGTVCIYPKNLEETLTIIGEKGMVSIGGLAVNKVEVWDFADGLDSIEDVIRECNRDIDNVYGRGHTPLYHDVLEAIDEDRKPYIDGRDGKTAMEIILAAYQSNRESKRIDCPLGEVASIDFK